MSAVVGVVGLGIMGGAIARSLAAAGWKVLGFDIDPARQCALAPDAVETAASLAELVRCAEIVLTSLPTAAAVHSTMQAIAGASGKKFVIEASTLSLADKLQIKKAADVAGHIVLDCPISGTGAQALVKDLIVYASGNSEGIEVLRPLFLCFAREAYDVGEFGNGTRMKLVANLLVAIHNVATAEAMVLAAKAGLDLQRVAKLIADGSGSSRVFELRAPLMVEQRYEPATMKLSVWQKDLSIIHSFADELHSPTPLLAATLPIYDAALTEGGNRDTASVCAVLEKMAGMKRKKEKQSGEPGSD